MRVDLADAKNVCTLPRRKPTSGSIRCRVGSPDFPKLTVSGSNPGYQQLVSAIDVPILLVIADGGVVSLETASELQRLNSGPRVEVIADAGHGLQYDQPERFEAVVRGFLRLGVAALPGV